MGYMPAFIQCDIWKCWIWNTGDAGSHTWLTKSGTEDGNDRMASLVSHKGGSMLHVVTASTTPR